MRSRPTADREIAPMTSICALRDLASAGRIKAGSPVRRCERALSIRYFAFILAKVRRISAACCFSAGKETGIATGANAEDGKAHQRGIDVDAVQQRVQGFRNAVPNRGIKSSSA